jgi:hypothetical protein
VSIRRSRHGRLAGNAFADYTQFLDVDALDGARIGVWREGTYDPTISPETTRS